jgi:hypothetical protein
VPQEAAELAALEFGRVGIFVGRCRQVVHPSAWVWAELGVRASLMVTHVTPCASPLSDGRPPPLLRFRFPSASSRPRRDGDGARRPRQDEPLGRPPQDQRRGDRGGRDHTGGEGGGGSSSVDTSNVGEVLARTNVCVYPTVCVGGEGIPPEGIYPHTPPPGPTLTPTLSPTLASILSAHWRVRGGHGEDRRGSRITRDPGLRDRLRNQPR